MFLLAGRFRSDTSIYNYDYSSLYKLFLIIECMWEPRLLGIPRPGRMNSLWGNATHGLDPDNRMFTVSVICIKLKLPVPIFNRTCRSSATLLSWNPFSLPLQIGSAHVYLWHSCRLSVNQQLQTSRLPHLDFCVSPAYCPTCEFILTELLFSNGEGGRLS